MESSDNKMPSTKHRNHWLNIRLTADEYQKMLAQQQKTTCKTLSAYGRKLLLGKPVAIFCRDETKEKVFEELAATRRDFNAVANNFNQVVRRIHKIAALPNKQYWLRACTNEQEKLNQHITNIQKIIEKIADTWLQGSKQANP